MLQETITANVSEDAVTLEFQRSDGTLITQLMDFRNVSSVLIRVAFMYINRIQRDATVCRCLFTEKLLYMFRVSISPIIRSTSNCNCSFWYRS